jgi:agmatinase
MSERTLRPQPTGWHPDPTEMQYRTFAGLTPPYADLDKARAVILPVPYESTTEWQAGCRQGPQAIIDASQYLELYDLDLDREIYTAGIATLPQVEPHLGSPEDMVDRVYHVVGNLLQQEKLVVMLGGEHSISLGAVRACKEYFPGLSVLQLDAHADLRDEYMGTRYGQASVMRRIMELCPVCQAGIRSLSREEKQFLTENSLTPFYMSHLTGNTPALQRMVGVLSDDVYVTVDADVLDPSIMPAVGTPEPDGMTWHQILDIVEAVALHRRIVGFDIVEFSPSQGPGSCAFLLAKLAYRTIGYALPPDSATGKGRSLA